MQRSPAPSELPPVLLHGRQRWPADAPTAAEARAGAQAIGTALLEHATASDAPKPAVIVVTDNQRSLLTVRRQQDHFELRLSWRLLAHTEAVTRATSSWMESGSLGDHLADVIAGLALGPEPEHDEPLAPPTPGRYVDLRAVLTEVAALADASELAERLSIRWSGRRSARRSLRLGSARPQRHAIRIHPCLDSPAVPEYVVRMVVYHELCHCVAPPLSRRQARQRGEPHRIHHAEFRALEGRFPELEKANRWVRDNFQRLLRY